ncbi:MAG: transposase [Pseudomonadales bacterium]|nr:transposase [Pseudomonadales bacterium]
MATPRSQLVDPENPLFYHLVSRCVRQSWLCGINRATRKNYTHRKDWLLKRLEQLGEAFSLDIYAYAIMSNHFHLVVRYDPRVADDWSIEEVADRWHKACPPKRKDGSIDHEKREIQRQLLLCDSQKLERLRTYLGSMSFFMKMLKQPIARRANLEDDCTGHFFDQRYYSGALLSEAAVLSAMAYVDLNPIRVKIASSVEGSKHTSIRARLDQIDNPAELDAYLKPVISGIDRERVLPISVRAYLDHLQALIPTGLSTWNKDKLDTWRHQVTSLKRRQRAFGTVSELSSWAVARGWKRQDEPLPN